MSTRLAIAVGACLIVGGIATAALALRSDDDSQGGSSRGDSQGTVHRGDSQGTVPRGCDPQLARLRAPGCRTVFNDTGADPDAERLWADIECVTEGRHRVVDTGGDPAPTALAQPQGNEAYRRLTVIDGDDLYGERCELGNNEHRACCGPNPAVYREGQHRITFISFWLPAGFPLRPDAWQGLLQMKQTQPSAGGGGAPAISVGLEEGRWILDRAISQGPRNLSSRELWLTRARAGRWVRFAFDIVYSRHRERGFIKVYVDLNGDGDAADRGERSPGFRTWTLKREIAGGERDGIAAGASIPSHLRVGIYHDSEVSCPAPEGCWVGVDNVQVVKGP